MAALRSLLACACISAALAQNCPLDSVDTRTAEVDGVCCSAADTAEDLCENGVPRLCDGDCAGVFVPWFQDCHAMLATTSAAEQLPLLESTFESCQSHDAGALFEMINDVTTDEQCIVHLPSAPIAPDCFDDGCEISGHDVDAIDGVESAAACQQLCAEDSRCAFFEFRTNGGLRRGEARLRANCLLKDAGAQETISPESDRWPAVCGPRVCSEVVEESFHWDSDSGMLGWRIVGPGVSAYAHDTSLGTYAPSDCIGNCELGEDAGEGPVRTSWVEAANSRGFTDLHNYGAALTLDECKDRCVGDAQCHGVTIRNSDGNCWTETDTPNSGDAPGLVYTTYIKLEAAGEEPGTWGDSKIWGLLPTPWGNRDNPNELIIARSPPFARPHQIEFDIMGGTGSVFEDPSSDSTIPQGYLGVCLRNAREGTYVRCARIDCGLPEDRWRYGPAQFAGACRSKQTPADWAATGIETWIHINWEDITEYIDEDGTTWDSASPESSRGFVDLYNWGAVSLDECKSYCIQEVRCHAVTIRNADGNCWTETSTPNPHDAPGSTYTTYIKQIPGDTVTQYNLDLIDFSTAPQWGHIELQDVYITAALADETPNQFYSQGLSTLPVLVAIDSVAGSNCRAHGTNLGSPTVVDCIVTGDVEPSGGQPPPLGLDGYSCQDTDEITFPDPIQLDGTWTVDVHFKTPISTSGTWHTLVRGQAEDHPILLNNVDEVSLGGYDNGGKGFYPSGFQIDSLQDGWHRLTVTGSEDITTYYIDGRKVGEVFFTSTDTIYKVCNWGGQQPWSGEIAGFMIFDEALNAGQVQALFDGGCTANEAGLNCQDHAEATSGFSIGDRVETPFLTTQAALCHAPDVIGDYGATRRTQPDPALARGTICGFDGSLVVVHWDLIMNLEPSNQEHPNCGGCHTHPDDTSCSGGRPYWTRHTASEADGGQPRSDDWLSAWMGDPGVGSCGVSPVNAEVKSSVPPFKLSKLTDCRNWPLCDSTSAHGPSGAHRRTETGDSAATLAKNDSLLQSSSQKVLMEHHRQLQHSGHLGLGDSQYSSACSIANINNLATDVDAKCCYQNGVYKCSDATPIPESCTYQCGVAMVPFLNDCRSIIENLFTDNLAAFQQLYDSCLNADGAVLAAAMENKECCQPEDCSGCKDETSCNALDGTCMWSRSPMGRQVATRCNCVGTGAGFSGAISERTSDFPDYASCHDACLATEGCNFFGVWEATVGDDAFPDYCRMWDVCEVCSPAQHYNTVWQARNEYELTDDGLTWLEAEAYCHSHGGHLASVHSAEEQANIWAIARGERVWIGLTDRGHEGSWGWSDGSNYGNFLSWDSNQPDNALATDFGEHEDCGEMYDGYGGNWNDRMCSSEGRGICKFSAASAGEEQCVPDPTKESKYVRVEHELNFEDARQYCVASYHDLASIHNAEQNAQALLVCQGGGSSSIFGDWRDPTGSFYAGSTIEIREGGWRVTSEAGGALCCIEEGDSLSLERIGRGFSLTEHDAGSVHAYRHMATLNSDGTLHVTEESLGHREWDLTRVSEPVHADTTCIIGMHNEGPGKSWQWSDGTDVDFQQWLGNEGAVAANAGRVADARIGLHDGSNWDDGPADDPHWFICERYH